MEIKIEIEDLKVFTDLAFMLDRDPVMEKIFELRKCWNIDKKLLPVEKLDEWIQEPHYDFRLTASVSERLDTIEEENHFGEIYFHQAMDKQKLKEISEINPLWFEVEYLLKGNGINIKYKYLVLKAIVCGKVTLADWEEADTKQINFYHNDWMFSMPDFEKVYKGDTKPEIKRDREWYWLYKNGKKQIEIAKSSPYRGKISPEDFTENVKQGIKRYRAFLKSQGTFSYS